MSCAYEKPAITESLSLDGLEMIPPESLLGYIAMGSASCG